MSNGRENDTPVQQTRSQYPYPLGSKARVLLTSVFGPWAQDDEYGSRSINPMELWHNQVTRVQGPFSVRMFNRSWGLMLIQANIQAPCTILDFPRLERFIEEIRTKRYDVVGIGSITINLLKVKKMCELVRQYLPEATIVVGGHIANIPDLCERIDADHIVCGEGVHWFRRFLGEDPGQPVCHPQIQTGHGTRMLGRILKIAPQDQTATLIPSVGCPQGCNFCITSAMFGGKGKFINFYETGDELFDIMCQLEESMKVRSFFVMDENFLMYRTRALRLLELIETHDKAWGLQVFSSAKVLDSYTIEQLVSLGLSWVWVGLEGEESQYTKLAKVDTFGLVSKLRSHGICVLGSTIIGMENHTPENIDQVIDYAVRHNSDFHQFMLYTPLPGTPLHTELTAAGRMKGECEAPSHDQHGQFRFNYRHSHITDGQETDFLLRAFRRDFEVNGPSVLRRVRTLLQGWKRYKNCPDRRIRDRYARESRELLHPGTAVVAGAKAYYRNTPKLHAKISALLDELCEEFGPRARRAADLAGSYVLEELYQEEQRLADGWTYEPPTFYDQQPCLPPIVPACPGSRTGIRANGEDERDADGAARDACHREEDNKAFNLP